MSEVQILVGDVRDRLKALPDKSVHCVVTSPPYFNLRDYQTEGQIGQETDVQDYVDTLVSVFREVKRVVTDDATVWLNLGDTYKNKQRLLVPARVALGMQADGWILRDEIVWHKPRTTPAPVKDRTVAAHEMLYCFAKSPVYFYDYLAIEEPAAYAGVVRKAGKAFRDLAAQDPNAARKRPNADREITVRDTRRKRSVWSISPQPYDTAHFAVMPPNLIEPCILAGSRPGDTILDPFGGAGTTALVARRHGRRAILIELNPDYAAMARDRIAADGPPAALETKLALLGQAFDRLTSQLKKEQKS